jgi:hypothetical protein
MRAVLLATIGGTLVAIAMVIALTITYSCHCRHLF